MSQEHPQNPNQEPTPEEFRNAARVLRFFAHRSKEIANEIPDQDKPYYLRGVDLISHTAKLFDQLALLAQMANKFGSQERTITE